MLVITSPYDLKRYLETRLNMAKNQKGIYAGGMVFAFGESILAVEALIREIEEKEKSAKDQDTASV